MSIFHSTPVGFYYDLYEDSSLPSVIEYLRQREEREYQFGLTMGIFETTFRLLRAKIGPLSDRLQDQVDRLSLEQMKVLGVAMLKFESKADLGNWLKANPPHYNKRRKAAKAV